MINIIDNTAALQWSMNEAYLLSECQHRFCTNLSIVFANQISCLEYFSTQTFCTKNASTGIKISTVFGKMMDEVADHEMVCYSSCQSFVHCIKPNWLVWLSNFETVNGGTEPVLGQFMKNHWIYIKAHYLKCHG